MFRKPQAVGAIFPTVVNLWARYKAENETAIANNAKTPSWTDLSSNARNAAQTTASIQATKRDAQINGKAVYDLTPGSARMLLPTMAGFTAGEIFLVVKSDVDTSGAVSSPINCGTGGAFLHYAFTGGIVYDDFGSTARKNCGNPAQDLAVYHCLNILSKPGFYSMRINNSLLFSTASNTVGFSSIPQFGLYKGRIAEAIFINAEATAPNRAAILTYISEEYALTIT